MTNNYPLYVSNLLCSDSSNNSYKKLDGEITKYKNNPQRENFSKKEEQ